MTTNTNDKFVNPHVLAPYYSVANPTNMSLMGYEDETKAAEWARIMTVVYPYAWPQFPILHKEFGYTRILPVIEVRRTDYEMMMWGRLHQVRGVDFTPGIQKVPWGMVAEVTIELSIANLTLKWKSPTFGSGENMREEITVSRRFIGRWARKQFKGFEEKANAELQSTLERAWWVNIANNGVAPTGIPEPVYSVKLLIEEQIMSLTEYASKLIWQDQQATRQETERKIENLRAFL